MLVVREPVEADFEQWKVVFANYQRFYRSHIADYVVVFAWQRFFGAKQAMDEQYNSVVRSLYDSVVSNNIVS